MKWVPKAKTNESAVFTLRPKVSTGSVVNNNRVKIGNSVKASVRWEWRPIGTNTSNNPNGVSMTFDRFNYIDTQGRSKSNKAWVSKRN